MKYRFVDCIDGKLWATLFTDDSLVAAMELRGFTFVKAHQNPSTRAELQGAPVFAGLAGPMWDGDAIRYEPRKPTISCRRRLSMTPKRANRSMDCGRRGRQLVAPHYQC